MLKYIMYFQIVFIHFICIFLWFQDLVINCNPFTAIICYFLHESEDENLCFILRT
jgi:hypothetical protein